MHGKRERSLAVIMKRKAKAHHIWTDSTLAVESICVL